MEIGKTLRKSLSSLSPSPLLLSSTDPELDGCTTLAFPPLEDALTTPELGWKKGNEIVLPGGF